MEPAAIPEILMGNDLDPFFKLLLLYFSVTECYMCLLSNTPS